MRADLPRKTGAIIFAAVCLAGCAYRQAVPEPAMPASSSPAAAMYGRWLIAPEAALAMPAHCLSVSYEFSADTVTLRSGDLVLVAGYALEASAAGLVFVQSGIRHNGGDNCQGVAADYVASHYEPRLEVELAGERLRLYLFGRANGRYVEFVRMPGGDR